MGIYITSVIDNGAFQKPFDALKVGGEKLLPLRNEHQSVAAVAGAVFFIEICNRAVILKVAAARFSRSLGVIGMYLGAAACQLVYYNYRRGAAHIVGVWLERQPPDRDLSAAQIFSEALGDLSRYIPFLIRVDFFNRGEYPRRIAQIVGSFYKRPNILGKAASAVAAAGIYEPVSDTAVAA